MRRRVRPALGVFSISSLFALLALFAHADVGTGRPAIDAVVDQANPACTGDPMRFVSQHDYAHEDDWRVFTLRNMAPGPGCKVRVWFDVYRREVKHAQGTVLLEVAKTRTAWVDEKTHRPRVWVRYARFE